MLNLNLVAVSNCILVFIILNLIMLKWKYALLKQFIWSKCTTVKQIRPVLIAHFQLSTCHHQLSHYVSKGSAEKRTGIVFNKRLNHSDKNETKHFVCRGVWPHAFLTVSTFTIQTFCMNECHDKVSTEIWCIRGELVWMAFILQFSIAQ